MQFQAAGLQLWTPPLPFRAARMQYRGRINALRNLKFAARPRTLAVWVCSIAALTCTPADPAGNGATCCGGIAACTGTDATKPSAGQAGITTNPAFAATRC